MSSVSVGPFETDHVLTPTRLGQKYHGHNDLFGTDGGPPVQTSTVFPGAPLVSNLIDLEGYRSCTLWVNMQFPLLSPAVQFFVGAYDTDDRTVMTRSLVLTILPTFPGWSVVDFGTGAHPFSAVLQGRVFRVTDLLIQQVPPVGPPNPEASVRWWARR